MQIVKNKNETNFFVCPVCTPTIMTTPHEQKLRENIKNGNIHSMFSLGRYYETQKNYKGMQKYYLMAIAHGSTEAMLCFGEYYEKIENYDSMKHYYRMAIDHGHARAMLNLGYYYQTIENNYDEMRKYYTMAIEHGEIEDAVSNWLDLGENAKLNEACISIFKKTQNANILCVLAQEYMFNDFTDEMLKIHLLAIQHGHIMSMYKLGEYYENEGVYDKMKKYYLMAIEKGDEDTMIALACYYENTEENIDEMIKYYLMAIQKGNANAMYSLGLYYDTIGNAEMMTIYYTMAITYNCSNAYKPTENFTRIKTIIKQTK